MKDAYPQKYPVFEADQLLSQHHLNQTITYTDNQNRLTRVGGIGVGIVCGLDLDFPNTTSVRISCGKAITTLGYIIQLSDKTLTKYRNIILPKEFLKPDTSVEPYLNGIFNYSERYKTIEKSIELLVDDTKEESTTESKIDPIPSGFLDNKTIILLLETDLIDQKDCLTTSCEDKGKRMDFKVRVLALTPEQVIALQIKTNLKWNTLPNLFFPRYNVPKLIKKTAEHVFNEFRSIFTIPHVAALSNAIATCYNQYKSSVPDLATFPLLDNVSITINTVLNNNRNSVQVQYLWDWLSDITDAYHEIIATKPIERPLCCVKEEEFPFHVVLGSRLNDVKTPFYEVRDRDMRYKNYVATLNLLFGRLVWMIQNWQVSGTEIKITPSALGGMALSKKAVPFYYNGFANLQKIWSPTKTMDNRIGEVLSYNATPVQNPLYFNMDPNNFFRIEGHIGSSYKNVWQQLEAQIHTYNLPFRVTAVNAVDDTNKTLDIANFKGRWDDLETSYDIARSRIFNITEFVVKWIENKRVEIVQQKLLSDITINQIKTILTDIRLSLPHDLYAFLPEHDDFVVLFKKLNEIFLIHRFCIQLSQTAAMRVMAEDLVDRFDDINELFLEDALTVIYTEAKMRWEKKSKELFFSNFIQKHHGIEHKAGVTTGGTFVLVYVDNTIFTQIPRKKIFEAVIAKADLYSRALNITNENRELVKAALVKPAFASSETPYVSPIDSPCKTEVDRATAGALQLASVNMRRYMQPAMYAMFMDQMASALTLSATVPVTDTRFEGLVIADFYVPYIIQGEGSPIQLVFDTKAEPTAPVISMDKLAFCKIDTANQEVKVTGTAGGTFDGTAKAAITTVQGKHYFNPSHASVATAQTYTLMYKVNNTTSNQLAIKIDAPETLEWLPAMSAINPRRVIFQNTKVGDSNSYEFNFGDGSALLTTNQSQIEHTFLPSTTDKFNVTIKMLGKACVNTQTIPVDIRKGDFDPKTFNGNDFNT
jgi:hypothetical protein